MEAIEYNDKLHEINDLSIRIDNTDERIHEYYDRVKKLVANEFESIVNKIDYETPINVQKHFLEDTLSPMDILIERVLEIRITKEVLISQLYRTIEEEKIRYEKNRAMTIAKKNLVTLDEDIQHIETQVILCVEKIETESKLLSKIWVNKNLQNARDKEILAKCKKLKSYLNRISSGKSNKWEELVSMINEIHVRRDRIEKLILTHENTAEVSELFNQIVNQEIKLLHRVLDDVTRYCQIHKDKQNTK